MRLESRKIRKKIFTVMIERAWKCVYGIGWFTWNAERSNIKGNGHVAERYWTGMGLEKLSRASSHDDIMFVRETRGARES